MKMDPIGLCFRKVPSGDKKPQNVLRQPISEKSFFYLQRTVLLEKMALNDRYIEGQDKELDKKYLAYKKMNLWAGPALSAALSKEEGDRFVDLERKEKRCAWKLTVQEVSTLVAWSPFHCFCIVKI